MATTVARFVCPCTRSGIIGHDRSPAGPLPRFVDTHCHLDAPEFGADTAAMRARAAAAGVALCVIPAVAAFNFETVRQLAHAQGDAYALGIHPLCTGQARDGDLAVLDAELQARRDDPRLVAVGEIGLDYFVPGLDDARQTTSSTPSLSWRAGTGCRCCCTCAVRSTGCSSTCGDRAGRPWRGIAHAFNGSAQQAQACAALGLKLGFGGAVTFERALQLRRLAASLPLDSLVLETDAPDIPPHWLYRTQAQRAAGRRRAATSRPSCRASRPKSPRCAASRRTRWRRRPRATRSRRCRGCGH